MWVRWTGKLADIVVAGDPYDVAALAGHAEGAWKAGTEVRPN
jgi:hypothetical protein